MTSATPVGFSHRSLHEGVVLLGRIATAAFALTVAEAYDAAPRATPAAMAAFDALKKHNVEVMFQRLSAHIRVEFTPDDPYDGGDRDTATAVRLMLYDILVHKRLRIYSGHSDDHPAFTARENVIFRTVHDFFTHAKLMHAFKDGLRLLLQGRSRPPSEAELKKLLPNIDLAKKGNIGHAFTFRGELNAYATHLRLTVQAAVPALFTEIVGQVSYYAVCQDFPQQKAVILDGFDFRNIGQILPGTPQATRFAEISDALKRGASSLDLRLRGRSSISAAELYASTGARG